MLPSGKLAKRIEIDPVCNERRERDGRYQARVVEEAPPDFFAPSPLAKSPPPRPSLILEPVIKRPDESL